jgi:hypothetical protein
MGRDESLFKDWRQRCPVPAIKNRPVNGGTGFLLLLLLLDNANN